MASLFDMGFSPYAAAVPWDAERYDRNQDRIAQAFANHFQQQRMAEAIASPEVQSFLERATAPAEAFTPNVNGPGAQANPVAADVRTLLPEMAFPQAQPQMPATGGSPMSAPANSAPQSMLNVGMPSVVGRTNPNPAMEPLPYEPQPMSSTTRAPRLAPRAAQGRGPQASGPARAPAPQRRPLTPEQFEIIKGLYPAFSQRLMTQDASTSREQIAQTKLEYERRLANTRFAVQLAGMLNDRQMNLDRIAAEWRRLQAAPKKDSGAFKQLLDAAKLAQRDAIATEQLVSQQLIGAMGQAAPGSPEYIELQEKLRQMQVQRAQADQLIQMVQAQAGATLNQGGPPPKQLRTKVVNGVVWEELPDGRARPRR